MTTELRTAISNANGTEVATFDQIAGMEAFDRELIPGSAKKSMKGVSSRDLWNVDPRTLRFLPDFNTRIDTPKLKAHIDQLCQSIMVNGFFIDQPITVFVQKENGVDVNYVSGGNCRTKAALQAIAMGKELATIPAVTEDRFTTLEELIVKLHRSNTGMPFTPFEIGLNCKRLLRFNWEIEHIAEKMGLGIQYTENLIMLVSSPMEIREAVIHDRISATEAIKILQKDPEKAVEVLRKMLARAALAGSKRATGKHSSGAKLKKAMKKVGMELYTAASTVTKDPAFKALTQANQDLLKNLLETLDKAKAEDTEDEGDVIDGEATKVELVEGVTAPAGELIEGESTRVADEQQPAA